LDSRCPRLWKSATDGVSLLPLYDPIVGRQISLEENDHSLENIRALLARLWGPLKANRYLDIKKVDRDLTQLKIGDHLVIDVGAGLCLDSLLLASNPEVSCISVDLQRSALDQGRSWAKELGIRGNIDFIVASALDLPIRDARGDVTVSYSAIDHLPSKKPVQLWFDEMSRVTHHGGHIILTTSNRLWLCYGPFQLASHIIPNFRQELFFRPSELAVNMMKAGLNPEAFDGRGLYYPLPYNTKGFFLLNMILGKFINFFQDFSSFKKFCGRIGYRATK
jgi:ubiquinone/menaquinone biosynthesis C-methylase UbiE